MKVIPEGRGLGAKVLGEPLTLRQVKERAIRHALVYHDWNVTEAAKSLGVGKATVYRFLAKKSNISLKNKGGAQ